MVQLLRIVNGILWDKLLIYVFLVMGLYFTIITRCVQIRKFPLVLKQLFCPEINESYEGDITPVQALYVALSSCVGNGNIVGVATSIAAGGPGAIFWMWIAAIVGAATKYSEILLGILFREKDETGKFVGGPIYYIKKGLGKPGLATVFAVLLVIQSSGGNLIQSNALSGAAQNIFHMDSRLIGIILAFTVAIVIVGGFKSLVKMTEKAVPKMAALYIVSGFIVITYHWRMIPSAFRLIFSSAFNLNAGLGGVLGYSIKQSMRYGIARGLYSNEAGEGSAPMVHVSAITDHPARQGLYGILEVVFDTLIVCTITALSILVSGIDLQSYPSNVLTMYAFETVFPLFKYLVGASMILFAFTTVSVQWYFGTLGLTALIGEKKASYYKYIFVILTFFGCIARSELVWELMDTVLGLLCIPNIITIVVLGPLVKKYTLDFENHLKKESL
ncbi:MAG: sodium:alanine symporter family protein [Tissierellia bacterium]|nr:sodium:alanine symporter family protein [Tissierellia bacterium]